MGLFHANITDAGLVRLVGLTNLQRLDLVGTPITDAGLEHLKRTTGLTELDPHQTGVTEFGIHELEKALPNLRVKSRFQ